MKRQVNGMDGLVPAMPNTSRLIAAPPCVDTRRLQLRRARRLSLPRPSQMFMSPLLTRAPPRPGQTSAVLSYYGLLTLLVSIFCASLVGEPCRDASKRRQPVFGPPFLLFRVRAHHPA